MIPEQDLAIVTSCTGYGIYLEEWARSLIAADGRPAEVGIFTHGTEADRAAGERAARLLQAARFHVKHAHSPERLDFGVARNLAVALGETPWVMHLDADDLLMPHAFAEIAALAPGCDVVALGYERFGDLASGPRFRRKLYRSSAGPSTLANPTPCSGCSPFRRSFWRRAPYRTDLIGGWDTALWLGFAHLGARFTPTSRPAFWYRQHADSLFNTRRLSGWPAARAGHRLESLRRGDAGVAVIVPRAPDGGARDAAWAWLERRYRALFPDWDLRVGLSPRETWRKGEAVAEALRGSTAAIVVLADADCVVDPEGLREAVAAVEGGRAPWAIPHGLVHRLSERQTREALERDPAAPLPAPPSSLMKPAYRGYAGGGLLVVGRSDFEAAGGIPRSFVGWGGEDEALAVILDTLLGKHVRFEHDLVHLWHQTINHAKRARGPGVRANRARFQQFLRVKGDVEKVWALVRGTSPTHLAGAFADPLVRHHSTSTRAQAVRDEARAGQRDTFAERRLADQQPTGGKMGGALDLARAHRAERLRQLQRNEEARAAMKNPSANKMQPVTVTKAEPAVEPVAVVPPKTKGGKKPKASTP